MPDDTKPQTAIAPRAVVTDVSRFANLMDTARFEHIQRVGTMFANSALVPEHFRGKQADCVIAVEMALRLDIHPFALMQSLYVVHGKPGLEGKMVIALINSSGLYKAPLAFKLEGEGMKRQCTAYAEDRASGAMCSAVVTMEMAKAEGWIDKSGSKWKTMPDVMLQYRSASFFGRLNCPQVIFGMSSREELEEIDVTPPAAEAQPERARPTLKDRLGIVDAEPAAPAPATPTPKVEPSLADMGIVVHDEPAQEPAQGGLPGVGAPTPHPKAENAAQTPSGGGAMPFESVLGHAKKAKTQGQVDIVRDVLRDPSYTAEQRQAIEDILGSKKLVVEVSAN